MVGTYPSCSLPACPSGTTGTFPACVPVIIPVTCDSGQHRDPQTNTCVPNGQSDDDNGKSACESAGGQWDAHTDPKCTPADVLCAQNGGTWSDQRCKSPEEVACEARGGSLDGDCYIDETSLCHQGEGGYSVISVRTTADLDSHTAHGDFAPTAGVCTAPVDACPGDLNPGTQKSGPCVANGQVCRNGATMTVASNAWISGDVDGACPTQGPAEANAAPEEAFVDPAVDVERGNSPLALGAVAAPDGGVSPESAAGVSAGGAGAGGAAAPSDDEDATLAEGDTLPVTGMSMKSTFLAALLAVLFGAFAYGEAARASRRVARSRA
jgi:hypothetical protein